MSNATFPYARNPRKNKHATEKVAASIKEFGFRQPIVVDSEMVIVAGHTRFYAAKKLKLKTVPVHIASDLSPAKAKAKVISKEEFEVKKRKLKDRQYEIDDLIRSYDEADDAFTNRLIDLLNLSAGALDRFRGSNFAEKRDLLNFVFLNLKLKGKKLEYSMRFPFSEFTKCDDIVKWSGR